MATWLSFCARRPGPEWKVGYGILKATALSEKEGEVKHSMEGTLAGALGVLDSVVSSSWHLSIPKAGPPLQHYPLEALCWHAGVQGDRRQDTSLIGNLTLIGEEHEDYPTNALNANQIKWTIKISEEIRRLCPRVAARPPTLRVNLWEHNWLSATSCPSGLIPWATIIAGLEDDMTDKEVLALIDKRMKQLLGGHIPNTGEMRFRAESRDGVALAAVTTLKRWFGVVDEHRKDKDKHKSGGITEAKAKAIAITEDKKLKVTK